ncbi:MAG: hypothetical protein BRC58_09790 [Cyanobacteria bacterium QS_8_64_29]|nr:MAG: hypothetical protein BRC58_09790 [Cyanobacteria bacterium QS_8_64_29]
MTGGSVIEPVATLAQRAAIAAGGGNTGLARLGLGLEALVFLLQVPNDLDEPVAFGFGRSSVWVT